MRGIFLSVTVFILFITTLINTVSGHWIRLSLGLGNKQNHLAPDRLTVKPAHKGWLWNYSQSSARSLGLILCREDSWVRRGSGAQNWKQNNFYLMNTYPVPSSILRTFHSFSNTVRKCQSWNPTLGLLTLTWILLQTPPQCQQLLTYTVWGRRVLIVTTRVLRNICYFFPPTNV